MSTETTEEPILTLRQFLRMVADHPAQHDTRLSADTLRAVLRDIAEHADEHHKAMNNDESKP